MEVELENGKVRPRGAESLPEKAHALLTILKSSSTDGPSAESLLDAVAESSITHRTMGDALRELNIEGCGEHIDLSTNKEHLNDIGR